ncbi:MAG: hypothetical protein AAFY65_13330 [Pseudomonadota bacterium]
MKPLPIIAALVVAGMMLWAVIPQSTRPAPTAPASDPVTVSPRPTPRACAGRVTNNPAILQWRRSLGCD